MDVNSNQGDMSTSKKTVSYVSENMSLTWGIYYLQEMGKNAVFVCSFSNFYRLATIGETILFDDLR